MDEIKIEDLLKLCAYGTHINIKLSDTGKIVINGVSAMSNSKDKRQKAKWEAFKNKLVYNVEPTVDAAGLKHNSHWFGLNIEAYIHRHQYDVAMSEYEETINATGKE